jgi:hypothetical protein
MSTIVYVATAWEEEYQYHQMFATLAQAQACAARWRDDLLDNVEVKTEALWEDNVLPF